MNRATIGLALIGGVVLLLGLGAGALIAGQVARPLRRLDDVAAQVAEGDLSARAPVEGCAEQQRLARTFNEMTERLGRLLDGQREFVADASHQLRTPLAGLRLRLEEAQATTTDADARAELDAALEEVDRLVGDRLRAAAAQPVRRGRRAGRARSTSPRPPAAPPSAGTATAAAHDATVEARDGTPRRTRAARAPTSTGSSTCWSRTRSPTGPTGSTSWSCRGPRDDRGARPGPGPRAGRGRRRVRALPPRPLGPRRAARHRASGLPIARELARRWGGDVRIENGEHGGARAVVTLPLAGS